MDNDKVWNHVSQSLHGKNSFAEGTKNLLEKISYRFKNIFVR